jgi:integrase/recombinase XerD
MSNLSFKRQNKTSREPLHQDEIKHLFEATQTSRERALLHLCYSCGLRRTEAESLNTSDIHFTKNMLYVREGKGAKRRAIPINESVKEDLLEYHQSKNTALQKQDAYMLNVQNKRMSGDSLNSLFKAITQNSTLTNHHYTLHHLRHSIATHLLENGLSIEFVRDFLGHTHLEATQIYTKVKAFQLQNL